MYFIFTTLSTVGLGDFHPKSSSERIVTAFIMLFGVMITSYLMDNLNKMLTELRDFNKHYDESKMLNLFIGTIKKFNENKALTNEDQQHLETFF